ncbi:MAG: hypothetical protein ACRDFZ_06495 [Candidatus Limnocylindria bacterium]
MASRDSWSTVPVHPVLVALLFPLYLLAANADQWVDLSVAWLPIAVSVAAGIVLFAACALLFRGWQRGGLVASLLLLLFFSFGHVRIALADSGVSGGGWAAIWIGLALLGLAAIQRGYRRIPDTTRLLNLVALLLVAYNLVSLGSYVAGQAGQTIGQDPAEVPLGEISHRPDVYYLVFDRYANEETLRELYGFDNSAFLAELEARGFTVARDSWANYGKTSLSLVSSLSLDFLDAPELTAANPSTFGPIHAALRGHLAVPATLKSVGYEYVHIGNWWEPGTRNVDADRVLLFRQESEFTTALFETTALTLLAGIGAPSLDPEVVEVPDVNRAHTLFEFEQVRAAAEASAGAGATYMFAHFLVPHPPYVFQADGSQPSPEQLAERGPRASYVEQLRWTNARILELLDVLQDAPAGEEPVIILQADEGPFPPRYEAHQDGFRWLEARPEEVQEKFGILNAYFLPGVDLEAAGVDDRTSPVNSFRVVFNAYFGTAFPLLPDQTYLSPDQGHLYEFTLYPRPD